jgi:hypothetical protein
LAPGTRSDATITARPLEPTSVPLRFAQTLHRETRFSIMLALN